MSDSNNNSDQAGNDVLTAIGALNEVVGDAKKVKDSAGATPEDVADWITIIGKAILALFKG